MMHIFKMTMQKISCGLKECVDGHKINIGLRPPWAPQSEYFDFYPWENLKQNMYINNSSILDSLQSA